MGLTGKLGKFCSTLTFAQLPPEVVAKAKICILDAIAVGLEGAAGEAAQLALSYSSQTKGRGMVWATGHRAHYLDAVLANCACVQSLLHDDVLMSSFAHPAGPVVCTVLGLGDELDVSGRSALLATVIGYEIMGRIGAGEKFSGAAIDRGFRGTPLFGVFAAAGAASSLMELSPEPFMDALGISASLACGLLEPLNAGTMEWRFAAGLATSNGVLAARMAKTGVRSAPTALEGRFGFYQAFCGNREIPNSMLDSLGSRFEIMDTWHKPFPTGSESTWVSAMMLVQGIVRRQKVDPSRVTSVVLRIMGRMLNYPGLVFAGSCETIDKAIMSKPFAVAAIIKNKTLNFAVYRDQLQDPVLIELARKVRVEPLSGRNWDQFVAEAEITMDDGTVHRGDPADLAPIQFFRNRKIAEESFLQMTTGALPPTKAKEISDVVFGLENLSTVSALTRLFGR